MTLDDHYYYFTAQISEKVCNDIIKLGVNNDLMKGTVYLDKDKTDQPQKTELEEKMRTSKV